MDVQETDLPEAQPQEKTISPTGIKSLQGQEVESRDWIDHGIVDVPVADLPMPEDVNSPDDFNHHISWEDARSATQALPQIQQEVNAGKTADDFSKEDEQNNLDWQHGRRRIYDLYYGCLLYTSDAADDLLCVDLGGRRIIYKKKTNNKNKNNSLLSYFCNSSYQLICPLYHTLYS